MLISRSVRITGMFVLLFASVYILCPLAQATSGWKAGDLITLHREARKPGPFAHKQGAGDTLALCSDLDPDYLSEVAADGLWCWSPTKLPIKVFFNPGDANEGYKSAFRKILSDCFDEWVQASEGKLSWLEVPSPEQADVLVHWSDKSTEQKEGTEAGRTKTYAQFNTLTHRATIHNADMTLLTCLPQREFSDSEVRRAYLHEVGHALGIVGHSSKPDDIMFFAVRKDQSPHLSPRDVATINHLYGNYQARTSMAGVKTGKRSAL